MERFLWVRGDDHPTSSVGGRIKKPKGAKPLPIPKGK